jgi:tetratricopeptide (TPR) repeat protein
MKQLWLRFSIFVMLVAAATSSSAAPEITQLLSAGRVNDAVTVLNNRDDAESLNLLSRAYFAMERWDEAVKYGERAVNLDPNDAALHLWLARAYGRKAGASNPLLAAGLARKAKNEFERAVQLDPSNVTARVDLAQYYTEAPAIMGGGLDKAREQAAAVEKLDKAKAHLMLARVAEKEKQYDVAERELQMAVKEPGNPADMWLQLAAFYRQHGRLDDMQNAVRSAIAEPRKPAESYFDAGKELYLGSRDFPNARQYLQTYLSSGQLVESAPAFRAHYLIGQLDEKMGRTTEAAMEYQAALGLASGFVPARQALTRVQ